MNRGRLVQALQLGVVGVLLGAWMVFLRPQWLGGSSAFITVRGDSMLPTYNNGDLLMTYAQPAYRAGDIVAYRVPAGEVGAGQVVVHRIRESGANGITIRGDNNPEPDPWLLSDADIVGAVVLRVPGLGDLMQLALTPTIAASIASTFVVMALVARATAAPAEAASVATARRRALAGARGS